MRCMADVPVPATVRQLPGEVRVYAAGLVQLTGRLDPDEGWYAVFAAHDPDGLRECLTGREIPPWDVVGSLLQDLGHRIGPGAAEQEEERLRALHEAAVAAHDAHAGDGRVLRERLAAARREREETAERVRDLEAAMAGRVPDAVLGTDLAWARDYFRRVEARCAELGARLAALEAARPLPPSSHSSATGPAADQASRDTEPDAARDAAAPGAPAPAAAPRKKRARSGGSRFAGSFEDAEATGAEPAPIVPPGAPSPDLAPSAQPPPRTGGRPAPADGASGAAAPPRGARFAGAVTDTPRRRSEPGPHELAEARAAAEEAVTRLTALRRAGRGGEAHYLLCGAAGMPALHLAVLVGRLQQSALSADAGTLLWEAATLPPAEFAAAADALCAVGHSEDSVRLLRQGVARPLPQIAEVALLLHGADRGEQARELLAAMVRSRTPPEVVQIGRAEPDVLVGALLDAAGTVSPQHYRSVANALRGAGLPGVPETA